MSRLRHWLTLTENTIAGLALATATVTAVGAVFLRTVFNILLFWSEEVIIYTIIASTFFGAVITLRENEHVNVDILPALLGGRGRKVMTLVAGAVTVLYFAVLGTFAWLLIFEPFSVDTVTPALHLPLWVVEVCVPIAFTLMLFRALEMWVRAWREAPVELSAEDLAIAEAEAAGIDVAQLLAVRRETGTATDTTPDGGSRPSPTTEPGDDPR